jgi:very-short-patch-repair endonuclease
MLVAYEETGSVGRSADVVGIPVIRHKRWLANDPIYRERFTSITQRRRGEGRVTGRGTGGGRPVDLQHRRAQQDRFVEAFERLGAIAKAAVETQVPVKNHYRWMDEDQEYTERFQAAETRRRDAGLRVGRAYGPWSEESKAKARAARTDWWENRTPEAKEAILGALNRGRARVNGGGAVTEIEADVMTALNRLHIAYNVHYPIGRYTADIFVGSHRIDIECDGSWWHENDDRRAHEVDRDAFIESEGITVLRLTETEIKSGDFSRLHEALKGA